MMKHFSKFAVAACLSLMAVAANAQTQTHNFTSVANADTLVTVTPFDTMGGTRILDSILVEFYNVQVDVDASATLNNPNASATVTATTAGNVRLRNVADTGNMINFAVDEADKSANIDTLPGGNPATTDFGGPYSTPAGIDTDADGFADIFQSNISVTSATGTGTGTTTGNRAGIWAALSSNSNTNFTVQNGVTTGLSATLQGGGVADINQQIGNVIEGTLRVTYNFHQAPPPPPEAPEPVSLAFMGMSVLGFVAAKRRK